MATHSSVLAWRIPGMGEPGGLAGEFCPTEPPLICCHPNTASCAHHPSLSPRPSIFDHFPFKWNFSFRTAFNKDVCGRVIFVWKSTSVQLSSVAQLCLTLCDPRDCSTPGFPVHHQLPEIAQTHVHQVSDAIHPSNPLLSPSLPAFSLTQHQGHFQWVSCSHHVAKVLDLQLQHQSFQWIFRTDFL